MNRVRGLRAVMIGSPRDRERVGLVLAMEPETEPPFPDAGEEPAEAGGLRRTLDGWGVLETRWTPATAVGEPG